MGYKTLSVVSDFHRLLHLPKRFATKWHNVRWRLSNQPQIYSRKQKFIRKKFFEFYEKNNDFFFDFFENVDKRCSMVYNKI